MHCTSCFINEKSAEQRHNYKTSKNVIDSLGKMFSLDVIGYVITTRTFGARVQLSEQHLPLWAQDDTAGLPEEYKDMDKLLFDENEFDAQEKTDKKYSDFTQNVLVPDSSTVKFTSTNYGKYRFCPTFGVGSRAHITLGHKPEIKPRICGFDLVEVIKKEEIVQNNEMAKIIEDKDVINKTYDLPNAIMKQYDSHTWVIYPKKKITVSTIFSFK